MIGSRRAAAIIDVAPGKCKDCSPVPHGAECMSDNEQKTKPKGASQSGEHRLETSVQEPAARSGEHRLEIEHDQDRVAATMELPAVVLGTNVGKSLQQVQRVLPGRVPSSVLFYPIYLLLVISGGIAGNVALDTEEWSFFMIALAWFLAFSWNWLYVIAWEYRRWMLKMFSLLNAIVMQLGLAAIAIDRGAPQRVANARRELVDRGEIASLDWVAGLLVVCVILLLLHFFWFGRGWRTKQDKPQEDPPNETVSREN